MEKIQKISTFFKWLFIAGIIIYPVLLISFWLQAPTPLSFDGHATGVFINFIPKNYQQLAEQSMLASTKMLGFIASLLPAIFTLWLLALLIRLFGRFQKQELFSLTNVATIRWIGFALLLGQLVMLPYQALLTAILSWHHGPGHRLMAISFSGSNLGIILIALLIILISWVMAEGAKLQQEQELTI